MRVRREHSCEGTVRELRPQERSVVRVVQLQGPVYREPYAGLAVSRLGGLCANALFVAVRIVLG